MARPLFYRFAILGTARAPWRGSFEEALADAEDADCVRPDVLSPEKPCLIVPGEIWETDDPVPTELRQPIRLRKTGPTSANDASRIDRIIARREGRISADL